MDAVKRTNLPFLIIRRAQAIALINIDQVVQFTDEWHIYSFHETEADRLNMLSFLRAREPSWKLNETTNLAKGEGR